MTGNKEFIRSRISIFAGQSIDPDSDTQVAEMLRDKFNIRLPQRKSFNESLASTISDHEIIDLILKYRSGVVEPEAVNKSPRP